MATQIELLGNKIQALTSKAQNPVSKADNRAQLLDALDDLRAEYLEPVEWPFSFLGPPEFAAMQVAFQRGVFQHVPLKPADSPEDATVTPSIHVRDLVPLVNVDEDRLLRIMRLLEANRVFAEVHEKEFAHTPLSAGMAGEYVVAHVGGQLNTLYQACSSLAESIEGGYPNAWEARFGMPLYEHFEKSDAKIRAGFAKSMLEYSRLGMKDLVSIFPWERVRRVVDVGGGAGHLSAFLSQTKVVSQHHRHLEFVNQDLPMVINDAKNRVASLPPEEKATYDRVEFQPHNYYDPQPFVGADAFILRHCLHNHNDTDCCTILRAMIPGLEHGKPGARLLVIEKLLPHWGAAMSPYKLKQLRREDMVMMISCGGKERSLEEFTTLVETADKRLTVEKVYYGDNDVGIVGIIAIGLRDLAYTKGV
ncbi:MAG: hypothetical protein LQ352_003892 [Teloschistes flavicans]|nr:MAG: hypothetical protein LQ352_003892 [Teloschistes flavicans]